MGDDTTRRDDDAVDSVWERVRSEERGYQLERVREDAARDARVAELLAAVGPRDRDQA